jgi:hypothetical protein
MNRSSYRLLIATVVISFLPAVPGSLSAQTETKTASGAPAEKPDAAEAMMKRMALHEKLEREMADLDRKEAELLAKMALLDRQEQEIIELLAIEDLIDKSHDCIARNDFKCSKASLDAARKSASNSRGVNLLNSAWDYHNKRQGIHAEQVKIAQELEREERRLAELEREEQRRIEEEEWAEEQNWRRAEREENRQMFNTALQQLSNSVMQGMQTYTESLQIRAHAEEEARRRDENRAREMREENNRRAQNARQRQESLVREQREAERLANESRDRERREAEVVRQQTAQREAEMLAQKQEEARKHQQKKGSWEIGDFKVNCWGSDKLYLASFVTATVTDGKGEPNCRGNHVRIKNHYSDHPIYVSVGNSNYRDQTLVPKQQVLVPLTISNRNDTQNTEIYIRVKYWKE